MFAKVGNQASEDLKLNISSRQFLWQLYEVQILCSGILQYVLSSFCADTAQWWIYCRVVPSVQAPTIDLHKEPAFTAHTYVHMYILYVCKEYKKHTNQHNTWRTYWTHVLDMYKYLHLNGICKTAHFAQYKSENSPGCPAAINATTLRCDNPMNLA